MDYGNMQHPAYLSALFMTEFDFCFQLIQSLLSLLVSVLAPSFLYSHSGPVHTHLGTYSENRIFFRFFRKNKGGKIPLWVSVQSDVRLFYVSQFYGQSKSNSNVVCVGRLSTDGTPRRPLHVGGNYSSILPFGPYVPQSPNKFEI